MNGKKLSKKLKVALGMGIIGGAGLLTIPLLVGCSHSLVESNNAQALAGAIGVKSVSVNGLTGAAAVTFLDPGTTTLTYTQQSALQNIFQTYLAVAKPTLPAGTQDHEYSLDLHGQLMIAAGVISAPIIYNPSPGGSGSESSPGEVESSTNVTLFGFAINPNDEATELATAIGRDEVSLAKYPGADQVSVGTATTSLSPSQLDDLNEAFRAYLRAKMPQFLSVMIPATFFAIDATGATYQTDLVAAPITFQVNGETQVSSQAVSFSGLGNQQNSDS